MPSDPLCDADRADVRPLLSLPLVPARDGDGVRLGEALMRVLADSGHDAVGLDVKGSPFTHRVGSIVDRGVVARALREVDAVVHAATLHKPHVATHSRQAFVDAKRDFPSA